MRTSIRFVLPAVLLIASMTAAHARPAVSLKSLLLEMVDRDAVAKLPVPAYTCKQVSSHDPRKNDPGNPDTWHSNSDSGQFIHTEVNEGRREWVIMEETGPGAIVQFWVPLLAEKDNQIVRFYLDGSPTPAISAKLNDLLSGQGFVRPPLAFVARQETNLRDQLGPDFKAPRGVGGDLYLPIPYARSCKVTLDSVPFYYHIDYRSYEPGTTVQTCSMAGLDAAKETVDRVSASLFAPALPVVRAVTKKAALAPGEEAAIDLPKGSAAVRTMEVRIDPADAPQVLRSVVLQATFDDEQTVWCPVGEFFGSGVRLRPVEDWWRTVSEDGTLTARWVMPYRRSGQVSLKNVGSKPVTVQLAVAAGKWRWDDRSLHLHANWRCQNDIKTRPISDWNYVELQGQGMYVGDTLTVFSPDVAWYGEGDERIYIDGATFPAHIGTGTEDYYCYAWGMCGVFNSPFISMPRRDRIAQGDWQGYTTTSRLRLLDAIPIETALKLDMEIWDWADTKVDYAVGTFWYARPGATSNREPQPVEAASPIRELPPEFAIAGAIECETLKPVATSPGLQVGTQAGGLVEGKWSGGGQLFMQGTKVGDFLELEIPATGAQPRQVTLYGTKAKDYGVLQFTIDGKPAGQDDDAYHPTPVATGPIELGTFAPKGGKLRLRVEVVGTNPASTGARYYFGLDCIVLK